MKIESFGSIRRRRRNQGAAPSGRFLLPGIADVVINHGDIANFDGATKITVGAWITHTQVAGANYDVLSRYDWDTNPSSQFAFSIQNGAPTIQLGDGGTPVQSRMNDISAVLGQGETYKIFMVYDGTLAAANRVIWYLAKRAANKTYPADTVQAASISGGSGVLPVALSAAGRAVDLMWGDRQNGGTQGEFIVDEGRIWFGTALTAVQVQAETLVANPVASALRWIFKGDAVNSGTLAPVGNGVISPGVVSMSDDY